MVAYEEILPFKQTLESGVSDIYDLLQEAISDTLLDTGDILDTDVERDINYEALNQFSLVCSKLLARNEEDEAAVRDTIYRSISFSIQVCKEALPGSFSCDLTEYISDQYSETNGLELLYNDAQEYMKSRPTLDSLTGYYMPEIDRSGNYNHVVDVFSGIVYMLAERSIGEQYITEYFKNISIDEFTKYS